MRLRFETKLLRLLLMVSRLIGAPASRSALDHRTERTPRAQTARRRRRQARFAAALTYQQAGLPPAEIARQSRLSREVVTVLLDRSQPRADDSAAGGSFFRILHSRLTRDNAGRSPS